MPNDLTIPPASRNVLPALLRKKLRPVHEDVYGEHGWEGSRLVSMSLAGEVTDAEREQAIATLEASLRRCREEVAIHEIAKLHRVTKSRREASADEDMLIHVLSDVLCEYPEDAVVKACGEWRANNVFFPAEAELRKLLDSAVAERKCALQAFRKVTPKVTLPPTPERIRARDVAVIMAKHGVQRSEPKREAEPVQARPGLSQAQLDAQKAENQAAYWLKMMGAG